MMKKTIIVIIGLFVVCHTIATISKPETDIDKESQIENETTQKMQPTQETVSTNNKDAAITISSDEYFDIVHNAIKKYVEPAGYTISRVSTLRMPYYAADCRASDIDTANFKTDALKIAEDIYHAILEHEYKKPSFYKASHEIISLTFLAIENDETANSLCIQFDLTDIDRALPFLGNLKMPITP